MRKPFLLILLIVVISCSKTECIQNIEGVTELQDITDIFVPKSRLPLFADLSDVLQQQTKSSNEPDTSICLASLLDLSQKTTLIENEFEVSQIPFKSEIAEGFAYYGNNPVPSVEESTLTKKFLILGDRTFVVTMITDANYCQTHPNFDYLNKPNYSGAILFSELDGTLIEAHIYLSGKILLAEAISQEDANNMDIPVYFIKLFESLPQTRATFSPSNNDSDEGEIWGWDGSPGLCLAEHTVKNEFDGPDDLRDPNLTVLTGPLSGGIHGNGYGGRSGLLNKNEPTYTVTLSTNLAEYISMIGTGVYTSGTKVSIGYEYKQFVSYAHFSYWTGDFSSKKTAVFLTTVNKNLDSTAYFDEISPCKNNTTGIMNPLHDMYVASSSSWGNYFGGTFGMTRTLCDPLSNTTSAKKHSGLDLYAKVGTPVYAAYSGVIKVAVSSYGNSKVSGSFGNELRIETNEDGSVFITQYAHLQAGNPIAKNPRTGKPFNVGDYVYQGDLIGYTGRTGNAVDVPNPHLHFGVRIAGEWVDPKPYINGTYNVNTINATEGIITDIKCN